MPENLAVCLFKSVFFSITMLSEYLQIVLRGRWNGNHYRIEAWVDSFCSYAVSKKFKAYRLSCILKLAEAQNKFYSSHKPQADDILRKRHFILESL